MTDLEQLLRQDLEQSAEQHPVPLSSADVLDAGRRHVRRRDRRRAAAGVSLALALGAGGWAASRTASDAPPLPASTPGTRSGVASVELSIPGGSTTGGVTSVRVEVDRAALGRLQPGTTPSLRFVPLRDGHSSGLVMGSTVEGLGHGATWSSGTGLDNVALGVLGAPRTTFVDYVGDARQGVTSDQRPLGDSGLTAFVVEFAGQERPSLKDVVYGTPDGVVRDGQGAVVPSVQLQGGPRPVTVYVSDRLDLFGVQGEVGAARTALRQPGPVGAPLIDSCSGSTSSWRCQVAGLLPAGSRDVTVDYAAGAIPTVPVRVRALPDGRVVYGTFGSTATHDGPEARLVRTVRWVDARGVRHQQPTATTSTSGAPSARR